MNTMKQIAHPISVKEFADALFKKLCRAPHDGTIGVAVSGGVDSMALAALCMQMQRESPTFASNRYPMNLGQIRFQGIIVNHETRPGSRAEAQKVMKVLKSIGMSSQILTLPWGYFGINPSKLSNFETVARRYRYQAMGLFCRKFQIFSLLVGHHADDQAETVVMRLSKGALGIGLLGIKPSSPIPECEGIYAVHESGTPHGLPPIPEYEEQKTPPDRPEEDIEENQSKFRTRPLRTQLEIELGGITLYRPLLAFPKERLIATCEALGVDWFEDDTNNDPTLTDRNAIRHLYDRRVLPWVLPKSRILSLVAQIHNNETLRREKVEQLLKECQLKFFDTRRGTLLIRFPVLPDDIAQRSTLGAMLLRRIIMTITPYRTVKFDQALAAVPAIFPLSDKNLKLKCLNTAGVVMQPVKDPEFPDRCQWHIFREPKHRNAPDEVIIPELRHTKRYRPILYDNRFWLLIHHNLPSASGALVVRFLNVNDIVTFKDILGENGSWILKRLLRTVSGEYRWRYSLPLVVWRPTGFSEHKQEGIIGLPTMGVKFPGFRNVEWWARYKKVDLYDLGLDSKENMDEFKIRRAIESGMGFPDDTDILPWYMKREWF